MSKPKGKWTKAGRARGGFYWCRFEKNAPEVLHIIRGSVYGRGFSGEQWNILARRGWRRWSEPIEVPEEAGR